MHLQDERWTELSVGARVPFDPRPLVVQLEAAPHDAVLWHRLIEGLYHEDRVGEASYAAVPLLVNFGLKLEKLPWQMLAIVPYIEMARTNGKNPPVPDSLAQEYGCALSSLAEACIRQLPEADDEDTARGMLCLIALWKGFPVFARAVADYSEEELAEILPDPSE